MQVIKLDLNFDITLLLPLSLRHGFGQQRRFAKIDLSGTTVKSIVDGLGRPLHNIDSDLVRWIVSATLYLDLRRIRRLLGRAAYPRQAPCLTDKLVISYFLRKGRECTGLTVWNDEGVAALSEQAKVERLGISVHCSFSNRPARDRNRGNFPANGIG